MESSSQDRSLPASERKLRRAIDDGQVTRSQYLSHLAVLGVGSLSLLVLMPLLLERMRMDLARQFSFDAVSVAQPGVMLLRLQEMFYPALIACVVFAMVSAVAVALGSVAVGGWVNSLKPLIPDLSRLDPLAGFGRLFTKDKLTEVAKMLVIVCVLGV